MKLRSFFAFGQKGKNVQIREHMLRKAAKTQKGQERVRGLLVHAMDVFIECGYEGASLDKIIRKAGGSKATLYQNFGSKEGLFIAALELMADDLYEACVSDYVPGRTLAEDLRSFGGIFLQGILAPRSVAVMRLIYAQSTHLAHVGQWFYQSGIEASYLGFAKVLENHINAPLDDLKATAAVFLEALRGPFLQKALCLPETEISDEEMKAQLERGIEFALAYIEKKYSGQQIADDQRR